MQYDKAEGSLSCGEPCSYRVLRCDNLRDCPTVAIAERTSRSKAMSALKYARNDRLDRQACCVPGYSMLIDCFTETPYITLRQSTAVDTRSNAATTQQNRKHDSQHARVNHA